MNKGSNVIMFAAVISLAISIYLWFTGAKDSGLFVGLWVPTMLSLANYFKR